MRIAIAGLYHETNRFGSVPVTPEVLAEKQVEGSVLTETSAGVRTYVGGLVDEAAAQGVEAVPVVHYFLLPSGPITREAFQLARDRIVNGLCASHAEQPLDAIALALHGAGAAEGCPDIEGELLQAIREKLGREIPIGLCLDLHGNISEEMVSLSDYLIGVRDYPHVDEYETGRELLAGLCGVVRTGVRPHMRLVRLPWLLVSAFGVTTSGAGGEVRAFCLAEEEREPELLRATFFHGFPYADVPMAGVSVVTVAATAETAERCARRIARFAWERRTAFTATVFSAEEAVDAALAIGEGPVMVNESSDNPGGGTPGDGTHLLRELLKRDVPAAFGFIYDPEVVAQAVQAGVGGHISCRLGGKTDRFHGEPIDIPDAYVRSISDGDFIRRPPMRAGALMRLGTTVCLVVGRVSVVVACVRAQTFDDGPFRIAGVDWQSQRILALKSSQHFKAWWGDKVRGIIPCDSPGVHSADLSTVPLQQADTSFYPLGDPVWNG